MFGCLCHPHSSYNQLSMKTKDPRISSKSAMFRSFVIRAVELYPELKSFVRLPEGHTRLHLLPPTHPFFPQNWQPYSSCAIAPLHSASSGTWLPFSCASATFRAEAGQS